MLNNPGRYAEKRKDKKGGIPACPLMSINQESERLCVQEGCAWYVKSYKMCSVYLLGHNAALDIKLKQTKQFEKYEKDKPQFWLRFFIIIFLFDFFVRC